MKNHNKTENQDQANDLKKHHDHLLETFVMYANYNIFEVGITLFVNGLIVTGSLISGKKYYEGLTEQIGTFNDNLAGLLMEQANEIYKTYDAAETDIEADYSQLGFIHLEDAKVMSTDGNCLPTDEGAFWRGKLSSIDGFILGTVKKDTGE